MSPAAHGGICTCPICRRERAALDRLARSAARGALMAVEAEEAAGASVQTLPGGTIAWTQPVALTGGTPEQARRALPPGLDRSRRLYRVAVAGTDVYVGMAPRSTVRQRIEHHLRRAAGPATAVQRGDEAILHQLLREAFAQRQPIAVRVGEVAKSTFYGDLAGDRVRDNKLLHAFEILAAFDLLVRRPTSGRKAYDPATWTFEHEAAGGPR